VAPLFTPRFVSLLSLQVLYGFGFSVFLVLPKYLATEFHAGPRWIGSVMAAGPLVGVVTVPLIGAWLDRGSRRLALVFGGALLALSAFGFLLVETTGPLILGLRAMQGFALTVTMSTAATLAADGAPPERLGQAIGYFGLASLATNALGPAAAEALASRVGWEPAFLAAGASNLLGVLRSLSLGEAGAPLHTGDTGFRHLLYPRSLTSLYVSLAAGASFGTVVTFAQPLALQVGVEEVSGLFLGYTAAAVAVRVTAGSAVDRLGRYRVSVAALIVYSGVVFATADLQPGRLVWLGVGLGLAQGLFYPAANAFVLEGKAPSQRGSTLAFFNGAFGAGFAACTLALGPVAARWGYRSVFYFAGAVALSAVAALLALPLQERRHARGT